MVGEVRFIGNEGKKPFESFKLVVNDNHNINLDYDSA